jgi:hypothetical protein
MSRALENYRAALGACPIPGGGVHAWMLGTANHAAAAGVDAGQAVAEITAAATRRPSTPSEVRDTVARAYRERGEQLGPGGVWGNKLFYPPTRPKPIPAPLTTADFIQRGDGAEEVDFWEASPVRITWGEDYWQDAVALLLALFYQDELVYLGDQYGKTVRKRDDWIADIVAGAPIPPLLCVNPLKHGGGMTAGSKPSPRCDDAVAVFRHAVAEFDGMSLANQFAFWWGWGLGAVSAVTFSGSKSLHVLLRVDCTTRQAWDRDVKNGLFRRRLIPLGCDGACANPARLSRLAGASRADKGGAIQKLLFVREPLQ